MAGTQLSITHSLGNGWRKAVKKRISKILEGTG